MVHFTPARIESHRRRLARWGSGPDTFQIDHLLLAIFDYFNVDKQLFANEIAEQRRAGHYAFCSRRNHIPDEISHQVLHCLPTDFPPTRLSVGRVRDAAINVERILPGIDYTVHYSSKLNHATYYMRHPNIPESLRAQIIGKPLSSFIDGIPDTRKIEHLAHNKMAGISMLIAQVKPAHEEITSTDPMIRSTTFPHKGKIKFSGGEEVELQNVSQLLPNNHGTRIYKREIIDYASILIHLPDGRIDPHIAVRPISNSKNPNFKGQGFHWDKILKCYLAKADNVLPDQLSATMGQAKHIRINYQPFIDQLIERTDENHSIPL